MADALGLKQHRIKGGELQPFTADLLGAHIAGGSHQIGLDSIFQPIGLGEQARSSEVKKGRVSAP
ncbi:hypothetical protein KQ303_04525 [Synechococcus sp. CS-1333]|nr:hypothetical protein [Synechococcus sp. CS-1333]